ncbi:MAG TPA: LuxR C-terminal-related transcriptional regulator [Solirubrobacteraceae bacterium]|jgi:DNA-binding CsgD family transcriptional regulator
MDPGAPLPIEDRPGPVRSGLTLASVAPAPVVGDADTSSTFDLEVLPALADLVCASTEQMAERARAALALAVPHDALVIVAPSADGLPVRIAASGELQERLAAIDWLSIVATATTGRDGVRRFPAPDAIAGLRAAGWVAGSAGVEVALIITATHKLEIGPGEERAACLIAMLAAARQRGVGQAPPPGTLAFSHAISQERDRVRWELASAYASTLAALLKLLRDAAQGPGRTPAGVAMAIDLASQALLDVKASAHRQEISPHISGADAFTETEKQLREIVRSGGVRLISGFEGGEDAVMPRALARAACLVSLEAALNATRHAGADKLRVHWRLAEDELELTIADNGDGSKAEQPEAQDEQAHLARRVAGLGGSMNLDTAPGWGTAVSCRLPLRVVSVAPDEPAAEHIAQLRPREREVVELMVAGLRNREIAERLFITVRTVKFHVSNILRKFEVQSRAEVIVLAHNAGISGRLPT